MLATLVVVCTETPLVRKPYESPCHATGLIAKTKIKNRRNSPHRHSRATTTKDSFATMSSGDDRSGPEGSNTKTSNSNNLNTVTKYDIYTGFVLLQYRNDQM
jgi:hypothetical protein